MAENGRIAIDLISEAENRNEPFDLIFVDLQMPIVDGYEVIQELRSRKIGTPIVVPTANDLKEERERCARLG